MSHTIDTLVSQSERGSLTQTTTSPSPARYRGFACAGARTFRGVHSVQLVSTTSRLR